MGRPSRSTADPGRTRARARRRRVRTGERRARGAGSPLARRWSGGRLCGLPSPEAVLRGRRVGFTPPVGGGPSCPIGFRAHMKRRRRICGGPSGDGLAAEGINRRPLRRQARTIGLWRAEGARDRVPGRRPRRPSRFMRQGESCRASRRPRRRWPPGRASGAIRGPIGFRQRQERRRTRVRPGEPAPKFRAPVCGGAPLCVIATTGVRETSAKTSLRSRGASGKADSYM